MILVTLSGLTHAPLDANFAAPVLSVVPVILDRFPDIKAPAALPSKALFTAPLEKPVRPMPVILLTADKASAVNALRLTGSGYSSATFTADSYFVQTIAAGSTAQGRVVNYDQTTGVLKYWQDRTLAGFNTVGTAQTAPTYGFNLNKF